MSRSLCVSVLALAACAGGSPPQPHVRPPEPAGVIAPAPSPAPALAPTLGLADWTGPFGGVVPFDRFSVEQLRPAFEAAMAEQRRELAAIAGSTAPPTFDNTIAAVEDSGRAFTRVYEVYHAYSNFLGSPELEAVERELEPKITAFWDELTQNQLLFQRIAAVHGSSEQLTVEQRRLVAAQYNDFVRAGAALDAAGRRRIADLNQRLSTLYTSFTQHVRGDEKRCVALATEADLAGLPEVQRAALAEASAGCGGKTTWAVPNTRSAVAAFLTFSDRRDLRERVWREYDARGDHGDASDNNAIITEILALRAERARLLGYPTYAHMSLANRMLKTPERALQLLESLWRPAVARARDEIVEMQAIANRSGRRAKIAPWDLRYYAEKVRKAKYDVDEKEVKPYLQLESLRDGVFHVARELFDLDLAPVSGVPVYHPDVRVFEAKDRTSGRHVGLVYFDAYARPGKYNGGQTDVFRVQERFRGDVTTLIAVGLPFAKPGAGQPTLLDWRDAATLFHELGHVVGYLSSNVVYPSLSGGRVVADYGEFTSLLFEKWLSTPEVLARFARHYQTGASLPAPLLAKILRAATFTAGSSTADRLASGIVELKAHLVGGRPIDPDAFERTELRRLGALEAVGMRLRLPHFVHVFASDAYAAGYYSYVWSDVLASDGFAAFTEAGGPFDAQVAARLRAHVFSVGNSVDPADGFRAFRGRDPTIDALLRTLGFTPAPR